MSTPAARDGLFAGLQKIAGALLALGATRLELLGNELEVQTLRLVRLLMLAQAILFCAGLGIVLLVMLMALLLWEQRLGVVAVFAALFLGAAVMFYRALMRVVNAPESAFAATLAEFQEDLRRLKAASGNADTPD